MKDEPKKTTRAVAAAIWHRDDLLLIFRKNKWNKWIMPGGGVDGNESLVDAVRREVNEEIGFEFIFDSSRIFNKTGYKTEWTDSYTVFEMRLSYRPRPFIDEHKFSGYIWLDTKNRDGIKMLWPYTMPGAQMYLMDKLKIKF